MNQTTERKMKLLQMHIEFKLADDFDGTLSDALRILADYNESQAANEREAMNSDHPEFLSDTETTMGEWDVKALKRLIDKNAENGARIVCSHFLAEWDPHYAASSPDEQNVDPKFYKNERCRTCKWYTFDHSSIGIGGVPGYQPGRGPVCRFRNAPIGHRDMSGCLDYKPSRWYRIKTFLKNIFRPTGRRRSLHKK